MKYWIPMVVLLFASSLVAQEWFSTSGRNPYFDDFFNPAAQTRRPWEKRGPQVLFDVSTSSVGGVTRRMQHLFDTGSNLVNFADSIEARLAKRGGPTVKDVRAALGLFASFSDYDTFGEGAYSATSTTSRLRIRDTILPRDAITFSLRTTAISGLNPYIEIDSLFGYRLMDLAWDAWEDALTQLFSTTHIKPTNSLKGLAFADRLMDAGYSHDNAIIIASLAEQSGIKFGTKLSDLLYDTLINTLYGIGPVIADGENPLDNNQSGLHIYGIQLQDVSIGYSFAVPNCQDVLTVGASVHAIRANRLFGFDRFVGMQPQTVLYDVGDNIRKSLSPRQRDERVQCAFDFGLMITPPVKYTNPLTISLSCKNINTPTFRWDDSRFSLHPQGRIGIGWMFFGQNIPFEFTFEADTNRVPSLAIANYNSQYIRFSIACEPEYEGFGFSFRTGFSKNLAESGEPNVFMLSLGLQFWNFQLDLGGEMSFTTFDVNNFSVPSRFGCYAQITLNIRW